MDEIEAYVAASRGRGFCEELDRAQRQHHQGPALPRQVAESQRLGAVVAKHARAELADAD